VYPSKSNICARKCLSAANPAEICVPENPVGGVPDLKNGSERVTGEDSFLGSFEGQ
jgi:hypothetical protein